MEELRMYIERWLNSHDLYETFSRLIDDCENCPVERSGYECYEDNRMCWELIKEVVENGRIIYVQD